MSVFNKLNKPIFLKEDSDTQEYIKELKRIELNATESTKSEISRRIKIANDEKFVEKNIEEALKNSEIPMYVLHDIHLEIDNISAQIDYLVITRKAIFIMKCKNLFGDIDIDPQGNFIRKYEWNQDMVKEEIESPLRDNSKTLEILKRIRIESKRNPLSRLIFERFFQGYYKTLLVLGNPKTQLNAKFAKQEIKDKVIRLDQLIGYINHTIQKNKQVELNDKEMKCIAENILSFNRSTNTDYAKDYEGLCTQVVNQGKE
jgi:hypothetical protein